MMAAYRTGDPHFAFAKQSHAVPDDATKESHEAQRERYKACYGMGSKALAGRISGDSNDSEVLAEELLADHKRLYKKYWAWSELNEDHAKIYGWLRTMFGWHINTGRGCDHNPRSMRNFPVQGGCADIMRVAAIMATQRGLPVCCPVHDAFLIHSPLGRLEDDIRALQAVMAEASRIALSGFELFTDVKRVPDPKSPYPDRYMDKRGKVMWETVMEILEAKYGRRKAG
jgi:DNA polymerase-1